ncbi:hypothetical protein KIPB_010723, partial [Kipferlia bialata]
EGRRGWFTSHSTPSSDGGECMYPLYIAREDREGEDIARADREGEEDASSDVIGYCTISPYRPGREALQYTAEISYYVDETHHRQGVASALVRHAHEECKRAGLKTLFAIIMNVNTASISFMSHMGYSVWGNMPGVADYNGVECGHTYMGIRL